MDCRATRIRLFFLTLSLIALCSIQAMAESLPEDQAPELRPFGPTFDATGYYGVHSSETIGHLNLAFSIFGDYAANPFTVELAEDAGNQEVITSKATGWARAAMGVTRFFDFGVTVPVTLTQTLDDDLADPLDDLATSGLGDIRVGVKGMVLDPWQYIVGLAFMAEGSLPTGSAEDLMGTGSGYVNIGAVVGYRTGDFTLDYQLAYRIRLAGVEDYGIMELADLLSLGVSAGYKVHSMVEIFAELEAATVAKNFFSETLESPAILNGGLRLPFHPKVAVVVGGGVGLNRGAGCPKYQAFAGVNVFPLRKHEGGDRDNDGVDDRNDRCPDTQEDYDGYLDSDGCPDYDNDGDGVTDDKDGAVNDPEDIDGFQDEDGIPDPDNDGDNILDHQDSCPDQPEDYNGRWDRDGCPDAGMPPTLGVQPRRIYTSPPVRFRGTSTELGQGERRVLSDIARYLIANPNAGSLRIEVHFDNTLLPARAKDLTQLRANAIKKFLVQSGMEQDRIFAIGIGLSKPLTSNRTAKGREKNRRVEFHLSQEQYLLEDSGQ